MAVGIGPDDLFAPAETGRVRRLAPNLQRLVAPNPSPLTGPGTNTYVVGFGPSYLVVDPGPDDTTHVDSILAATNGRISHVLCTHSHPDHSPGAAALKASTQAVVLGRPAPRDEHQDESYRPDRTLDDGDVIRVSGAGFVRSTRRAAMPPRIPCPFTSPLTVLTVRLVLAGTFTVKVTWVSLSSQ